MLGQDLITSMIKTKQNKKQQHCEYIKTSGRVRLKVISKYNVSMMNFQLIFNFSYCLVIVKLKIRDTELQILSQVENLTYRYQKK